MKKQRRSARNQITSVTYCWFRWNWNQLQSCVQLFAVHQNLKFCFRKSCSHVWTVKSKISSQARYRKENSCCNHTKHHTGHAFFISLPLSCHDSYLFFSPNGDAYERTAQPLEPGSDIDSGQKDLFFLSYCYVFYIRVKIWVLARVNSGALYRKLQGKLQNKLLQ